MKILATKDFVMTDGDVVFSAGKTYEFTHNAGREWIAINDDKRMHYMSQDSIMELNPLVTEVCFDCGYLNLDARDKYRCYTKQCPAWGMK